MFQPNSVPEASTTAETGNSPTSDVMSGGGTTDDKSAPEKQPPFIVMSSKESLLKTLTKLKLADREFIRVQSEFNKLNVFNSPPITNSFNNFLENASDHK